jgi:superfamily II DNA or RNA helicase
MARLGPLPMTAHARWDDGAVCLWGWDGSTTASVGWLTGQGGLSSTLGNHRLDLGHVKGSISRVEIVLPDSRVMAPSCLRLHLADAWPWFVGLTYCDDDVLSPTLSWFTAVVDLARAVVHAGRLRPALQVGATGSTAHWRAVPGPDLDDAVAHFDASRPLLAVASTGSLLTPTTRDIVDSAIDGIARSLLGDSKWKPPVPASRQPRAEAVRSVFNALAARDAHVRQRHGSPGDLRDLAQRFEREVQRASGEPIVDARLRLVLPADDDGPDATWRVVVEVVDEHGRWCTAADVAEGSDLAAQIAGGPHHLGRLADLVGRTIETLADAVPVLVSLRNSSTPGEVRLDIDEVADFLSMAPPLLDLLGIPLLGPEALVRARPTVRGVIRSSETGAERSAGLGARALVEWSVDVSAEGIDGVRLTDEEIARATAAGVALLHVGGRWVQLDAAQLDRARRAVDEHRGMHSEVDAVTLLRLTGAVDGDADLDTRIDLDEYSVRVADGPWIGDLVEGLPDEALTETIEPASFTGELRHYQRRGLSWLQFLARLGVGGVLADDMGLGKTATTLAHLLCRPGPHLVVCPLSVVRNWQTESARFAPSFDVHVHHGADRHDHDGDATAEVLADHDLVITTYGLVARDLTHLLEVPWSTIVLDEAQMVKNPATRAARALRVLRGQQVIALTGTPVENHLTELWSILDIVNPGILGTQGRFREHYAKPIERDGDELAARRLRRLTQPFVLRRTKADKSLLPDLPDKVEQIAWAALTREQTALYEGVVEQLMIDAEQEKGMKRRGLVLAALTRLKQICNHPAHALGDGGRLAGRSGKLARFDELVDELLEAGEQALVFTQFREMGNLLQRHLAERSSLTVPFLHGGVPRTRRDALVERFQARSPNDGTSPLMLVSLKAGGTGLNLTAATRVIHYDRWWNPAVEDQASDRAWRIGQTRTVFVHKLVCQGTVEEKISRLIDDKRAIADAVVGNGEAWLSEFDTEQLRELVRLDGDL